MTLLNLHHYMDSMAVGLYKLYNRVIFCITTRNFWRVVNQNGKKKLNWTVFLALFAVFSSDERTLKMLDSMEVFQEGVAKEM